MESTKKITMVAMCVAFCCISAYITFPLPFTPGMVTAVTLAFGVTAFVLPPKETALAICLYLALGAIGIPVLPGGTAGLGRILGPTGGFYLAWPVAYYLVSLLKGRSISFKRYAVMNIVIGIPLTYLGGLISMMMLMDVDLMAGLAMAVLPFIPGDIMKSLGAAFLGVKVNKMLAKQGGYTVSVNRN
ncbi:biotin transporter BioY [Selenomonas sp. KH1T6]|uniref:biotin transporter BioY n=1 Tax=Selenomonas sp. KH1T6 TaxID=3158784 RepID=UPI0008A7C466|nr:biotin transport system substrate-specific component [Selenomonas ruminantium]